MALINFKKYTLHEVDFHYPINSKKTPCIKAIEIFGLTIAYRFYRIDRNQLKRLHELKDDFLKNENLSVRLVFWLLIFFNSISIFNSNIKFFEKLKMKFFRRVGDNGKGNVNWELKQKYKVWRLVRNM